MAGDNVIVASSIAPKVLYSNQLADTTEDTLLTVAASTSVVLKHGMVTNISGQAVQFSMSIYASGQALSTTHRFISNYELSAGASLPLKDYLEGACLGPGDYITAQSQVANAINIILSGVLNS